MIENFISIWVGLICLWMLSKAAYAINYNKTYKHKNNDYLYKFDNVLNKVFIYNIFEIKHIFYLNIEYFIRFT
tara:strand:+ start:754 stop:972 length:219 start_codon:yes stop_codon:yes gene_type:complete